MTNRIKYFLAAGLVTVTVAAIVPSATAQDGPMRHRGPGPGMGGRPGGPGPMGRMGGGPLMPLLRGLDLTEAQQGQVKSIVDSHQDEFRAAGEKVGAARKAMRTLIEADEIDESAIRARSVEVAAAEADAAILNAKVRSAVFAILTPEQVQKANELRSSRAGQMKQRRPGRQ